jgi:ABC-type transport system involved in multi-copper enzyme maturation permease subunit
MIWLLVAEARKLARPLIWGSALGVVAFLVLLTWAATNNARSDLASPRVPDVCVGSSTTMCRSVISRADASARTAARATSQLERPGAVGQVAAGMLASLPGLLLIALVSGGHWGGEWSSRTIRTLLTREGRRGRVLLAKWLAVWAVGVATLIAAWAVLAVLAPLIAAWSGLPAAGTSLGHGLGLSVSSAGHAILVLGLFSVIGIAAGTIARGQLATTAIAAGFMLVALVLANAGGIGAWSPASFVQSWMGFGADMRSYLPTNFWSRFVSGGASLTQLAGLAGIAVTVVAVASVARWRIGKDVTA